MKKVSTILFLLMLGVAFNGFSQASAPSNFFVGTWENSNPNPNPQEGDMSRVIKIRVMP